MMGCASGRWGAKVMRSFTRAIGDVRRFQIRDASMGESTRKVYPSA